MRLEILLRSEPVAVAATDDRLETSEAADAEIEETSDWTDEISELIPVGTPLPSEEAADSAEEINELASEGVPPKAEVTSLAIEVATETIELTAELRSD